MSVYMLKYLLVNGHFFGTPCIRNTFNQGHEHWTRKYVNNFFWGEAFLMALFYKKKKSENQKHVSSPCSYHCKRKFIGFKNPSLFVKQMHRCKTPCIDVKMQYDIVSLMICVSLMTIIINRVDKGISRNGSELKSFQRVWFKL